MRAGTPMPAGCTGFSRITLSGWYLDHDHTGNVPQAWIIAYDCHDGANQQWEIYVINEP